MELNPFIFREYDIRGVVGKDLDRELVYNLGKACGTYLIEHDARHIAVGRDCRISSPEFRDAIVQGLTETGCSVLDVGLVPTPVLYFALFRDGIQGGIMITASHNPGDNNGFKVALGKGTIFGEEIQKLKRIMQSGKYATADKPGQVSTENLNQAYMDHIVEGLNIGPHKRKLVVDAGNGTGGVLGVPLYERLGFDVLPLYCEQDGNFPNHHPDPTVKENVVDMVNLVKKEGADLGIGYDGDTDRIGVIDEKGNIIWGDQLMIIFSRAILKKQPGATFIGEVKCSQIMYDDIKAHNGNAIMWKVGHSLIKDKLKETGGALAGEMSGHIFFADRYFGYDDAIYAGARLLEILSHTDQKMSDLLADIPKSVNTPEIRVDCPDDKKFEVVKILVDDFKKDHEVIDIDGARVLFENGWALCRASNTSPKLVLRFEASNQEELDMISREMHDRLDKLLT